MRHAALGADLNPALGWGLAAAAIAVGYVSYGWRGVLLGLTVIVFWLLLQFSRALRAMKAAASKPMGHVDSAVMLHSKLRQGMLLSEVMKLTHSFGLKRGDEPESYAWRDSGGDEVVLELRQGKLASWRIERAT